MSLTQAERWTSVSLNLKGKGHYALTALVINVVLFLIDLQVTYNLVWVIG